MLAERRCVLKWHLLSLSFSECPYPTPPTYPHTHSHQLLHTHTHTVCCSLSWSPLWSVVLMDKPAEESMTHFNRILSKGRQMALTEAKLSFAQACMEVLYKVFWADLPCMQTQTNFCGDCYHIYLAGFYALNQHVQWKTVLEKRNPDLTCRLLPLGCGDGAWFFASPCTCFATATIFIAITSALQVLGHNDEHYATRLSRPNFTSL